MLVLSNLGCQVFFTLGLMDQKGCDELRIQEENLDTLMWFKLLFVPTLGVVILTLFLLEDYCYSQGKLLTKDAQDFDGKAKGQKTLWQGARGADAAKKDGVMPPVKMTEPTRVNLVDENGVGNCYKIEPSISMREVVQFYCQRHNCRADTIVLRYHGKRISLSETPGSLQLQDLDTLDVHLDYAKMLGELREETQKRVDHLKADLSEERRAREAAEERSNSTEAHLKKLTAEYKALESDRARVELAHDSLTKQMSKLEGDLRTHREARKNAEAAKIKAERELSVDKDKKERKRLEKALEKAKQDLTLATEEAAKTLEKEKKTRESVKDALSLAEVKVVELNKELKLARLHAEEMEKECERERALRAKDGKGKGGDNEDERLATERLRASANEWRVRAEELTRVGSEREEMIVSLHARIKAVEAHHAGLVRQLEKENGELQRVRQALLARIEKDQGELQRCKQQRTDMEVELGDLRLYRQITQNAAAAGGPGLLGTPPGVPPPNPHYAPPPGPAPLPMGGARSAVAQDFFGYRAPPPQQHLGVVGGAGQPHMHGGNHPYMPGGFGGNGAPQYEEDMMDNNFIIDDQKTRSALGSLLDDDDEGH